jgi:stage II sporulation SpoE-like protein
MVASPGKAGASYVTAQLTVEVTPTRDAGRKSNPLRSTREGVRANKQHPIVPTGMLVDAADTNRPTELVSAAARQGAQLPGFAPLLEELEVAGWSSHRRALSGNFHDWMLLKHRTLLVMAAHATGGDSADAIEAALVAQGAWAAIRSHAHHAADAGVLLSLTARSLWPIASAEIQASVAVALVDLDGGQASVAAAGDCLALKIRATGSEQIVVNQPAIGTDCEFEYPSQSVQLSLRDRILLVADDPGRRPAKLTSKIATGFSQLDAETHRRMMAADAVSLVRQFYDPAEQNDGRPSASIVAVRRR